MPGDNYLSALSGALSGALYGSILRQSLAAAPFCQRRRTRTAALRFSHAASVSFTDGDHPKHSNEESCGFKAMQYCPSYDPSSGNRTQYNAAAALIPGKTKAGRPQGRPVLLTDKGLLQTQ